MEAEQVRNMDIFHLRIRRELLKGHEVHRFGKQTNNEFHHVALRWRKAGGEVQGDVGPGAPLNCIKWWGLGPRGQNEGTTNPHYLREACGDAQYPTATKPQ